MVAKVLSGLIRCCNMVMYSECFSALLGCCFMIPYVF